MDAGAAPVLTIAQGRAGALRASRFEARVLSCALRFPAPPPNPSARTTRSAAMRTFSTPPHQAESLVYISPGQRPG